MELIDFSKEKAKKHLRVADHMLTQTFKFVNDPKLLLAVLENVFLSMIYSMTTLLLYERQKRNIPPFQKSYASRMNMFRVKIAPKYKLKEYELLIEELREHIDKHKKSPVEFKREKKFVICDEDYEMDVITEEKIREYINYANDFFRKTEHILKGGN